jgi:hypothetical protein
MVLVNVLNMYRKLLITCKPRKARVLLKNMKAKRIISQSPPHTIQPTIHKTSKHVQIRKVKTETKKTKINGKTVI